MDFKGITWVGNIYQKFEAMCLEVEEVMYQDTVKYMENQVQKVGVCVKKIYSEVMEDLLPPCCADPMKLSSGDLSINPCAHTDINKKQLSSMLDSYSYLKKKISEDEVISDVIAEKELSPSRHCNMNSLCPPSPDALKQNKCYESFSGKSKKLGAYKRPIGIRRISQDNHPSKNSSRTTSLSGDRSTKIASCDVRSNSVMASADVNVMSSPSLDERSHPGETVKENAPVSDNSIKPPDSENILSAELVRLKEGDSKCISPAFGNNFSSKSVMLKKGDSECTSACCSLPIEPTGTFMNDTSFSELGSSIRHSACDFESQNNAMASYEGKFIQDGLSNVGSDTCNAESGDKDLVKSNEDKFNVEIIEKEEATGPRAEIFEPVEGANLDESCVLVEGYKLHYDPQVTTKKSYKKKICKALSSKLKSTRKQDQFVSVHKDLGGKNNAEVTIPVLILDTEKRNLPAHDSFESNDWELV